MYFFFVTLASWNYPYILFVLPYMRTLILLTFLLFIGFCTHAQLTEDQLHKAETVMKTIDGSDMLDIVKVLCTKEMGGRLTGSPGFAKAVDFASKNFQKWGLLPLGDSGTYYQNYPHPYSQVYAGTNASLLIPGKPERKLIYPDEYAPGANSDKGKKKAEIVYAGYAISLPEYGYDELKDLDIEGKIVVVEDGHPYVGIDKKMREAFEKASQRSLKIDNLVARGAIGIVVPGIIINPNIKYAKGLLSCHLSESILSEIFEKSGYSYSAIKKDISRLLKPFTYSTGCFLTIESKSAYFDKGIGQNVLGFIPGTDPVLSKETIVLCAHLDHVGYSEDLPIAGANDNASGSSLIMRVGRALTETPFKLKRSVLVLLLGGEETGLVGSGYYAEHPVTDISKALFLNFDMVGMGDNFYISGGDNFPGIYRFFKEVNSKYFSRLISSGRRNADGRPRTDGAMFYRNHQIAFDCGLTGGNYEGYYHHPKDLPDFLRPDDMRDMAKLIYMSVVNMAMYNDNIIPDWN